MQEDKLLQRRLENISGLNERLCDILGYGLKKTDIPENHSGFFNKNRYKARTNLYMLEIYNNISVSNLNNIAIQERDINKGYCLESPLYTQHTLPLSASYNLLCQFIRYTNQLQEDISGWDNRLYEKNPNLFNFINKKINHDTILSYLEFEEQAAMSNCRTQRSYSRSTIVYNFKDSENIMVYPFLKSQFTEYVKNVEGIITNSLDKKGKVLRGPW
ncbi:MAG: hypothetical protein ACQESF_04895 [Nanobdellota archaeon]